MIQVESISKSFGSHRAVDGISFSVERGEVLGFLGPNGAGKSTTMRMITGFIAPDAGRVSVCGFDVASQPIEAKSRIGYLPESAPTYSDMTVGGFLRWVADMRSLRGEDKRRAVDRAVELCSLGAVFNQSIDTLSKGFKHRTCLAQAILHDPPVLILDEPTDGLDPNQKREVRELIRRMSAEKSIIFSTHILEEVEAICSRAIVIHRGRVVANASPAELKTRSKQDGRVRATVAGADVQAVRDSLNGIAWGEALEVERSADARVVVRARPAFADGADATARAAASAALSVAVAQALSRPGWRVESLQTEQGRLDEVFHELTQQG